MIPTSYPTDSPTPVPTTEPTPAPSAYPTNHPTPVPTTEPTPAPTAFPTNRPSPVPTTSPTNSPTAVPTPAPTVQCKVYALLAMPLPPAKYGSHENLLIVRKKDEFYNCQYYEDFHGKNSWGCLYQGRAIARWTESNYLHSNAQVFIDDAAEGRFTFDVSHFFDPYYENYYPEDLRYYPADYGANWVGVLYVNINGRNVCTAKKSPPPGQNTHLPNGEPNPLYNHDLRVVIDCDANCQCAVGCPGIH